MSREPPFPFLAPQIRETTNSLSFHRNLEAEQYTLRGDDISESLTYVEDLIGRQEPLVKVWVHACVRACVFGVPLVVFIWW